MKKILLLLTACSSISLMGMEKQITPLNPMQSSGTITVGNDGPPPYTAQQDTPPPTPFVCTAHDCEECLSHTVMMPLFALVASPFTLLKDTCCIPCDSTEKKCYPRTKDLCSFWCRFYISICTENNQQ